MLTACDLLRLPYTTNLTEGGIAYACRSLADMADRSAGSPMERLRQNVAEAAVELAFRRTLSEQGIPYDVLGTAPFSRPERYDVSLGGHRCILKSTLITRRSQITLLRKDLAFALKAPALFPLDELVAEGQRPDDIYLFSFLLGLLAASLVDEERAMAAGQPIFLIHLMPDEWAYPANWLPLEKLAFKSECEAPIRVEIGGQNAERVFHTVRLELPPKKRVAVEQDFHSLAYIHAERRPERRIGLHSPARGEAAIIRPHEWGNIWVYGMGIYMAGWLTHEEYRRKAKMLNSRMSTLQVERARGKNMQVPMGELNPLRPLFERVRQYTEMRRTMEVRHT